MGCGLTFDKLLRAELRVKLLWGVLRAKLLRGGAGCGPSYRGLVRAAGQDVEKCAVRAGLRAKLLRCRAGCVPGFGAICGAGLAAG